MKNKAKISNNFDSSSYFPCKKHPSNKSSIGICAYCLNEKLIELICIDCGEQRMSSCSCSDLSSYRNSSCTVDLGDIGSVGRMSFLIENEKDNNNDEQRTILTHMKMKQSETKTGDVVLLKRSSSCVVDVKKRNGFWKIGNIFKNNKEKEGSRLEQSVAGSSAKMSDFDGFESRKSGIKNGLMKFENGVGLKDNDFGGIDVGDDDDEFIDLKIDLFNKSKTEHSVFKKCDPQECGRIGSSSCRITVNENGIKKVKNNHVKSWKWGFKYYS